MKETENLDREKGEAFIDVPGFEQMIQTDAENSRNLFLVAAVDDRVVGFSRWADSNDIQKITLNGLETNEKAIELYKKCGFEIEGLLKKDKLLSDGKYYNTIIMGRLIARD